MATEIWYHGTNTRKKYKAILKDGFLAGTYFTPDLSSALAMGGKYIFAIESFSDSKYWEIISEDPIPASKILYAQKYSFKLLHLNKDEYDAYNKKSVLEYIKANEIPFKQWCPECSGRGEYRADRFAYRHLQSPGGASLQTRTDSVNVCTTCHGFGYLEEKYEH